MAVAEVAAATLRELGLSVAVVDARFAKPLDRALLEDVARRCGHLVTLEDHLLAGGFGSAVLQELAGLVPETKVLSIGLDDVFVEHGETNDQWTAAQMDAPAVAARTRAWLEASEAPAR